MLQMCLPCCQHSNFPNPSEFIGVVITFVETVVSMFPVILNSFVLPAIML
ncbi:hypothetical protein Goarm_004072 [Gossypium armourianum]|uniref:Uncharacterized protein n=1 Tax=Gossypium armourianum TaxID=34283 RepID=A0A7J9K576_9ROSI|nr:hypothetical protein [Gossypium armourianum]